MMVLMTGSMKMMECSSLSEGEVSMGSKLEESDILQGGGGWLGTATVHP